MARYIDADALIAEYDRVHIGAPGGARKLMVDAPTADVVEVVRCKDCKYCNEYQKYDFRKYLGCNQNGEIYEVEPNHFCSYGERKEDG